MKKVDDALTDVGYGDGWFKVSEAGLNVASKIIKVKISLDVF
jgi:cellulase